ncbi:unnamed protein product [Ectocarpus sp. CCAP 1310/34]|nr:unnamed protein product [Ectocarpus sp. CCAP 1310/34]
MIEAPGERPTSPSFAASRVATSVILFLGVVVGKASGWKECLVSPQDAWKAATDTTAALRMRYEYERRYTCRDEKGALQGPTPNSLAHARRKSDDSPPLVLSCLDANSLKRLNKESTSMQVCLKGRRVIFLGDSLSNQQGDSLLGMLGWHPDWMTKENLRNAKVITEDGKRYYTLVDCWHPSISGVERCYDYSTSDFPGPTTFGQPGDGPSGEARKQSRKKVFRSTPSSTKRSTSLGGRKADSTKSASTEGDNSRNKHGRKLQPREWEDGQEAAEEAEAEGYGEEVEAVDENEISVHMRMLSKPSGEHWLTRAVSDFNETRASDIFVVNFGGHYHDFPEEDDSFKRDVFPILDEMAVLGEKATVVWREIAPTHFPAVNGSFDAFDCLESKDRKASCTGTPPEVFDRNVWVENYLRTNGLEDRIHLLRIYDMSVPRGAAHHTCHFAPPSPMNQSEAASDGGGASGPLDCRHWSETGVVEEWNTLMLNHLCPME